MSQVVASLCEQDASANTAIARKGPSLPARKLAGKVGDGTKVLDYGCGKGQDLKFFDKKGAEVAGYDPNHKPEKPDGKYEVVTLFYVLNVIKDKGERASAVKKAAGYLQDGGALYVSARSKAAIDSQAKGWKKSGDGYETGSGTFQHGMTQEELVDLLSAAGLKASGWDLGTGDSVGAVGRKQSKNEVAIEAILQGMPLQEAVDGLLESQALWEGTFGGVDAAYLLHQLGVWAQQEMGPDGNRYKALADRLWNAIWKVDDHDREMTKAMVANLGKEHLGPEFSEFIKFNQDLQSILKWPDQFWDALSRAAQAPFVSGTRSGQHMAVAAGVAPAVVDALYTLHLGPLRDPTTDYGDNPMKDRQAWADIAKIANVIERFPQNISRIIRHYVKFCIKDLPGKGKRKEQEFHQEYEPQARDRYGITLIPDVGGQNVWRGRSYFSPSEIKVYLRSPVSPDTVAHELGHFIWNRVHDPVDIRKYIQDLLLQDVNVAQDTGDLFRRIQSTFLGLKTNGAVEALSDVKKNWGGLKAGGYIKGAARVNFGPLAQHSLAKAVGTAADRLVSENQSLLGSWNEIWAEGFARIISGHSTVRVPGAMLSLIEYLLKRAA